MSRNTTQQTMFTNTGCELAVCATPDGMIVKTPTGAEVELVELTLAIDEDAQAMHLEGVTENDNVVRLYWHVEDCPDVSS